jgi:hypothetical protein
MAGLLNFPPSPNTGDTYSVGNNTWIWNGAAWIKYSPIVVNTATFSTSTNTGAVVIDGGLGVNGSVNIKNTSTIAGAEIITTATLNNYVRQTTIVAGTDTAVNTSSGVVTIWNTSTLQSVTSRGNTTDFQITILNTSSAYGVGSGALFVAGGISAVGDLWLGGTIYSGGVPVITTSSLGQAIYAGTDISITTTGSGGVLVISNTSTLQTVTTRGAITDRIVTFANTTNSTSSGTGAVIVFGGIGVGGRINCESVQIADAIIDSGETFINSTNAEVIDLYPADQFRTAKYLIQIDEGSGPTANFHSVEMLLLVDNVQNVYATEYAVVTSNGDLGQFAADVQGDNLVRLYFTAYNATNKIIKVFRTTMEM